MFCVHGKGTFLINTQCVCIVVLLTVLVSTDDFVWFSGNNMYYFVAQVSLNVLVAM